MLNAQRDNNQETIRKYFAYADIVILIFNSYRPTAQPYVLIHILNELFSIMYVYVLQDQSSDCYTI